jgi:putative membrane protein
MKTLARITLLFVCFIGCNKKDIIIDATLNKADVYFMQQASYANLAEITAGALAASKGSYDSVKMFGSMMVTDHTKAQSSLNVLSDKLNVQLPTEPDSAHKAQVAYLQTLSGYAFDTAYINAQVIDHYATISLFETEILTGRNPWVKNYANKNLPVIKMHLEEALSIVDQLE